MTTLPQHGTFVPLFHAYLDMGLTYHQAALVAYIDKWNRGGKECFASVEEIAEELRLTYMTMRRVITRSISQNVISGSVGHKGRARTLKITPEFLAKVHLAVENQSVQSEQTSAQSEQGMCSKRADQVLKVSRPCVQSEQLPRSKPISIPKSNYPKENLNVASSVVAGSVSKDINKKTLEAQLAAEKEDYLNFKKSLLNQPSQYDDIPD